MAWVFNRLQIKCIHDKINNKLQITVNSPEKKSRFLFIIYLCIHLSIKSHFKIKELHSVIVVVIID